LQKRGGQDVGRSNGILDGEIDPDTANRRRGVGGITDAQQLRPIPPTQAIDANGQQLDITPIAELTDAFAGERRKDGNPLRGFIGGSLRDEVRALPIICIGLDLIGQLSDLGRVSPSL
jgi:hypothetical protein